MPSLSRARWHHSNHEHQGEKATSAARMFPMRLREGTALSKNLARWTFRVVETRICSINGMRASEKLQPQQHHLRRVSTGAALGAVVVRNPSAHVRDGRRSAHDQAQGDRTAGDKTFVVRTEDEAGGGDGQPPARGDDEEEEQEEEEEEEEVMAKTRGRKERRDSVTESIVREREQHLVRLAKAEVDTAMAKTFKASSLGSRKRPRQAGGFNKAYDQTGRQVHSEFAAGGFARWMGSASKGWPTFRHRLPEVALAGHTNCGKSTLVNALSGIHPRRGPASTSDRAGWTDLVGFYQVGKKPPVLTLVDLPGYGHAVATRHAIKGWLRMIKEYITTRQELIRCCVLVDCTRGFCEEDRALLQLLAKRNIPYQIVLTKADLLTPELLSACVLLLRRDLSDLIGQEAGSTAPFSAVCGTSGAGVTTLWKDLAKLAAKAPGSLVAMQAAHLAARKAREKEEADLLARKAARTSREH